MSVRIRGIYATALTKLAVDAGRDVVQASPAIEDRFDRSLGDGAASASIATTRDRQGVEISGDRETVAALREDLADVGIDALAWPDPAPLGAVFDGVVDRTRGGGAVVELPAGAEGYLPFDSVDGYVDVGDRLRVQVHDPRPPWDDDAPLLGTEIRVPGDLVTLRRGREGVTADAGDDEATELARTVDLLSTDAPDGWGIHWEYQAVDASMDALDGALGRAAEAARAIDEGIAAASPPSEEAPEAIATPFGTSWAWFGRESRFELDRRRGEVTATMRGHHRIKAATEAASAAVDFVEALCSEPPEEFPFEVVTDQFGPREGDRVAIHHGKPGGEMYSLGRGEVTDRDPDGTVTVRREIRGEGTYDALGTPREPGDVAITKLTEGRWWYPTAYRGEDGERKGTYVNVCTPVELFPDAARYVDLHVDVIDHPDGPVEVVDEDELDAAVEAGDVPEDLAEKAREVAAAVEKALS